MSINLLGRPSLENLIEFNIKNGNRKALKQGMQYPLVKEYCIAQKLEKPLMQFITYKENAKHPVLNFAVRPQVLLLTAAQKNLSYLARYLLNTCGDSRNCYDNLGKTPLHYAAQQPESEYPFRGGDKINV